MEEEISNSSLNFINPSEIELGNSIVELSRRQTCILHSARWNSRRYVLKSLRGEFASNPVYIKALRKEFELGVRLDHPGIIRVVAFEEIDTLGKCIVMEWVDGRPLNEFLRKGVTRRERRKIATQLAEALTYMHGTGISHRDLKPDNILITRRGHDAKIIDFGLGDADSFTSLKSTKATRSYGPPELQEAPAIADSPADVYSFGKILQELLPRWEKRRLIRRCLRTEPERRPQMAEVLARLTSKKRRNIFLAITAAVATASVAILISETRVAGNQAQTPADATLRVDTIYIAPSETADSSRLQHPPIATATESGHKPDGRSVTARAITTDSIFRKYQRKADAIVEETRNKLLECTSSKDRVGIFTDYSDKNNRIADSMEAELRGIGCSELTIQSVRNSLYTYMSSPCRELIELSESIEE